MYKYLFSKYIFNFRIGSFAQNEYDHSTVNILLHRVHNIVWMAKIYILRWEGIVKIKVPNEHCVYEFVGERNLFKAISLTPTKNKLSTKG